MKKEMRRFVAAGASALALAALLATSGCTEETQDLMRQAGQAALDEVGRAVEEELGVGFDELGDLAREAGQAALDDLDRAVQEEFGVGLDDLDNLAREAGQSALDEWAAWDETGGADGNAGEPYSGAGSSRGDAGSSASGPVTVSAGLRHAVSTELTPATVERVVDGDTLKVVLGDTGESQRVRLIGINTPESVAPEGERNTAEGVSASDFLKEYLLPGQRVWLMFDTDVYDDYDRMLAYVWTEVPRNFTSADEVATKMVNGYLAYQGYAVVHAYAPNDAYCDLLHDLADDAEFAGRGLWEISSTWADGI